MAAVELPTIELCLFHPSGGGVAEDILFFQTIDSVWIEPGLTLEIPTGGSPVGNKRPLMLAIRRIKGDTTDLGYTMFTVTFSKTDELMDSSNILTVVADVDNLIGGDNNWSGMYLGHQEAMEVSRIHITWGGDEIPTPSI